MHNFAFGGLRITLIYLVLITMLPVFGIIIYRGMQDRDAIRQHALTDGLNMAKDISEPEGNTIEGVRKSLFLLSQMLKIHDLSPENMEMVLKLTLEDSPELAGLIVVALNGDVIADSYHSRKKLNVANLPPFQRLLQTKKFVIGEYQVSRISGHPLLTVWHPVFDKTGRVKKIIGAGLKLGRFKQLINRNRFSPHTHVNIVDHNGTVLFRYPEQSDLVGKSMPHKDIMQVALTKKEGVIDTVGRDGVPRIYGFSSFGQPYGTVYVTVGFPKNEVFAAANRTTFYHLLWLLGITVMSLIIASLFGRTFILHPLDKLLRAAKQIANGDVTARVGYSSGRGEIAQLIHAFDRMGEVLQEHEDARAQAVRSLQESEITLRTIFKSSVDAIGVSKAGIQTFMNPAYLSLFGYSSTEELIGRPVLELVAPSEHEIILERLRSHAQGEVKLSQYETRGRRKDGTEFDMDVHVSVYDLAGETYSLVILRDISERKEAEKALRQSEARLRESQASAHIGSWDWNLLTNELSWSEETYRIFSQDPEEVSLSPEFFLATVEPDERASVEEALKDALAGKKPYDRDIHIIRPDGTKRVVHANARVDYDEAGQAVMMIGTVQDITDRSRMEEDRRKLEDHLHRAEKMEAIGKLAGGIAHDFNNLLMGIQGYASLMLFDLDRSHPNYLSLKRIEEQVQSGADLTRQLLGFSRGGRYDVKPRNMNDIIDKTSSMFGRTKKEIIIQRNLAEDLWIVEVDQGQMEQVFMNLYVNAWQAMPGGGELDLETSNIILDGTQALPELIAPGKYVKITVTDRGTGMDVKTKERIFEPFFTTKAMGRGTGLGLATVYGIVKGHKGMIGVDSMPGQGTTFTIYLPVSEKEVVKEKGASEKVFKGTGTILLVDDEKIVLEVSKAMLESLGYRTYLAGSGQEAIAVYMEKRGEIDMVILDMTMPGISGGETFDQLREINPEIKVLLSSGYSIDGKAQEILNRGCNGFLQKPFRLEKLSGQLREMLE